MQTYPGGNFSKLGVQTLLHNALLCRYDYVMNTHTPADLFDLMSRWDTEAKAIPSFIRRNAGLSANQRRNLLARRETLNRVTEELRDAMAEMAVTYRGVVDGVVVIEADNEEACWAVVHDEGTVEFRLCSQWALTDSAIEHQK